MPTRVNDPFIPDAPRRPISRQRAHLQDTHTEQAASSSLAGPSARRNLFAATLSRRPTTTTTTTTTPTSSTASSARLKSSEAVHQDESEAHSHQQQSHAPTQGYSGAPGVQAQRRSRPISRLRTHRQQQHQQEVLLEPEEGEGQEQEVIPEFVVRDARGGYLHEIPGVGEQVVGIEDEHREEDARLTAIAREFWASGGGMSGRGSRKMDEEEYERPKSDIMARLRESVGDKLAHEKWMYGPTDYMESLRVAHHGRL